MTLKVIIALLLSIIEIREMQIHSISPSGQLLKGQLEGERLASTG